MTALHTEKTSQTKSATTSPPPTLRAYAGVAIREAIAEHGSGPHWVSQPADAGGARRYEVRLPQHAAPVKTLVLTKARVDELLAMLPIRCDQELAEEVDRVFSAKS